MPSWVDLISWVCFVLGGLLCITGGVGLLRFPDFFTRVHAVGVTETLAAPLLLSGLALQLGWTLDLVKVVLIMAFILATNPTATHAMARAALHGGHRPVIFGEESERIDSEGIDSEGIDSEGIDSEGIDSEGMASGKMASEKSTSGEGPSSKN
ncbi:MAG: monovalent cation/H(+) antiporter subunit G [Motiliproteus sp.]|nr:monovalent cation/H(+) antiporter subunit G [Motiliproteus sp.]